MFLLETYKYSGPEFSFMKLVDQGIVWQFDHRSPFPATLIAPSLQPLLPKALKWLLQSRHNQSQSSIFALNTLSPWNKYNLA